MEQPDLNQKTGKWMNYAAWIIGFFLLTYWFQNFLDNKENPNQQPISEYQAGGIEVTLQRNAYGHYVTNGYINRQSVTFLLDTGATNVSIPQEVAERLNLPKGPTQSVNTANGIVQVYQTRLDSLNIGDIQLRNVAANINPYMQGEQILLGMSALKRIEFSQRGDQLTLKQY
ncbi:TIGR02281 family clan AA aspartic protease [Catenovulum sp. 2E275]|uniref:retropepsin-like aspartic protease family protein n=1 Tax=Catenovulum sp. 2E275 TaxID=2980497 RepID=UPI0021D04FA0|nr:TIGR02281 family clan AA aspartic protease [Catenovulum sp. 2E275]MCU4677612.1 TIGR02281 family clan AA aspartic protease [Catenovulum sp. 2E275]